MNCRVCGKDGFWSLCVEPDGCCCRHAASSGESCRWHGEDEVTERRRKAASAAVEFGMLEGG